MQLSLAVASMTHRTVCYFIPQPADIFPYHVHSVDRRTGFDGFSCLRFCGPASRRDRRVLGFPQNVKATSLSFLLTIFLLWVRPCNRCVSSWEEEFPRKSFSAHIDLYRYRYYRPLIMHTLSDTEICNSKGRKKITVAIR